MFDKTSRNDLSKRLRILISRANRILKLIQENAPPEKIEYEIKTLQGVCCKQIDEAFRDGLLVRLEHHFEEVRRIYKLTDDETQQLDFIEEDSKRMNISLKKLCRIIRLLEKNFPIAYPNNY